MLQSIESQTVGHDLATEQQQKLEITQISISNEWMDKLTYIYMLLTNKKEWIIDLFNTLSLKYLCCKKPVKRWFHLCKILEGTS